MSQTAEAIAMIGSRETPKEGLAKLTEIAKYLSTEKGYWIRSGGAPGADRAAEKGAERAIICLSNGFYKIPPGREKIYPYTEQQKLTAGDIASEYLHVESYSPGWARMRQSTRDLYTRNVFILLGLTQVSPSEMVIYWNHPGKITGGTAHSIRVAKAFKIPTYNIAIAEELDQLRAKFSNKGKENA
jgi:hypothetical protein